MKRTSAIMAIMLTAGIVSGCNDGNESNKEAEIIGKSDMKIESGRLTPEALWAMGRIGEVAVSPDAGSVVYGVSYYSVEQNKSHHTLHIMDADGSNSTQLTTTSANETGAAWIKGGSKIAFLSDGEVWEMNPDGSERRQLSNEGKSIEGFLFSPDETKVILINREGYRYGVV